MDEIAHSAGLTKGALYWHFENKLELYKAVVELAFQEPMHAVMSRLNSIYSAKEGVEEVVRATIDFYRDNELVMEFYSSMLVEGKMLAQEDVRRILAEGYRNYRGELASMLEDSGMPSGIPPKNAAAILISCLDGIFIQWSLDPKGVDLVGIEESIVAMFTNDARRQDE